MAPRAESTIDDWNECTPGMLSGLAASHRAAQMRRKLLAVGGSCAIVCVALVAVLLSTKSPQVNLPRYGGVSCMAAIELMHDYFSHSLTATQLSQVERHLADCKTCREKYRKRAEELDVDLVSQLLPVNASPRYVPTALAVIHR